MLLQQNTPQQNPSHKAKRNPQRWTSLQSDLQGKTLVKKRVLLLFLGTLSVLFFQTQEVFGIKKQEADQTPSVEKETKQMVSNKKSVHIAGFVLDEEERILFGVSIQVKGSHIGAITNMEGKYEMNIPIQLFKEEVKLIAELEGFEKAEAVISHRSKDVNFVLKKSAPVSKRGKGKKKKRKKRN